MSGCVSDSSALNENVDKLSWLEKADARADAELALSRGDSRLMAIPLRNKVIPGIELDKSRDYELKCGVILMQGITDAIRGEEHLRLTKLAHQYAEQYNNIIKSHCKP